MMLLWFLLFLDPGIFNGVGGGGGGGGTVGVNQLAKKLHVYFILICPTFFPKHGNLERTNSPFSSSL